MPEIRGSLGQVLEKYAPDTFSRLGDFQTDPALSFPVSLSFVPPVMPARKPYRPRQDKSLAAQELQRPFWAHLYRVLGNDWFEALFSSGQVHMPVANSFLQLSGSPAAAGKLAARQQAFSASTPSVAVVPPYSGPSTLIRKASVLYKVTGTLAFASQPEVVFPHLRHQPGQISKRLAKIAPLLARLEGKVYKGWALLDSICPTSETFVPLRQVAELLYLHIKKLFPPALLHGNWPALKAALRKWVFLRRFSTLKVAELAKGFKTSMPWLALGGGRAEALKRQDMLYQFIYWLFVRVVEPLASFHFYATEASQDPGGVFFYRRDVWQGIKRNALAKFQETLEPFPSAASLEPGKVRVVPKTTGARVLVNLKAYSLVMRNVGQITNQMAAATPALLASTHDTLARLTEFRRAHPCSNYFMVKIDMKGCYDSVDIDKMMALLHERLDNRSFVGRQLMLQSKDRRSRSLLFLAESIARLREVLPRTLRSRLLIEAGDPMYVNGESILESLEVALKALPLQVGGKTYVKKQGLPQGSSVSAGLCNTLYGDLVMKELQHLCDRSDSLLLRYVDDFLFVSTDEPSAAEFLRRALAGFPAYGACIEPSKLQTNLSNTPTNSPRLSEVTFVGYRIDCKTLQGRPLRAKRIHMPPMSKAQMQTKLHYDFLFRSNAFAGYRRCGYRIPQPMGDEMAASLGQELASRMNAYGHSHSKKSSLSARYILLWVSRRYRQSGGEQPRRFMRIAMGAWLRRMRAYRPALGDDLQAVGPVI